MDHEPPALSLRSATDVLAYLPYRFGYVPQDSFAVLALLQLGSGPRTLGLAARLDLEDLRDEEVRRDAFGHLLAQLEQDPTAGVVTVLYSEASWPHVRRGTDPVAAILGDWWASCRFAGPGTTFLVGPDRFTCLACPPSCCPPEGRSNVELRDSPVSAQMVLAGEVLVPDRDALGCPRTADPDRRAHAAAAALREAAAMRRRAGSDLPRWREQRLGDLAVLLDETSIARARPSRSPGDPALLGRLGIALAEPLLRDAVVAWVLGGRRLRPGCDAVEAVFDGMLSGGLEPPAAAHLDAATSALTELVRHSPAGRAGYALAMLAWLAWWRGQGARADVLRHQCLVEDPGCRLGLLLSDALDAGVRPGWARPERTVAPGVR